ncbi:MAG TPA: M1 family aminopeptidase [Candidatus Acidoferrum sp.]|jgi:hypothetical protein
MHTSILNRRWHCAVRSLYGDAETDYTPAMKFGVVILVFSCLFAPLSARAADRTPRQIYDQLNALRVDPATVYSITGTTRIEVRRGDALLSFEEGKLAFLAPFDGRITGAVFTGRGHALAVPRGTVEKQQMAHFVGAPLLDQDFTNGWLRFTDETAAELLQQLRTEDISPQQDPAFASRWDTLLAFGNPAQSLRLLFNTLSRTPQTYFYAGLDGIATGQFDVVYDLQREEPMFIGQARKSGNLTFYDVWSSYKIPEAHPMPASFQALHYAIETSVLANNSLDATTAVRMRAATGADRMLVFQLSPALSVDSVTGDSAEPLTFFQNDGMTVQQRAAHGNEFLYVILPAELPRDKEFTLRFHYRGNVIEDAGNGVLFVGARESWYPHFGGTADFAGYDITMRWPRRLRMIATGAKIEEHEDGDSRVGHWRTEKPVSVAGFNLGEYVSASLTSGSHSVDVYANRQLEQALQNRLGRADSGGLDATLPPPTSLEARIGHREMQTVTPSPADALKGLGREIDSSIRFYEAFSGPFPYQNLSVSQIPGSFGQGWPGLLYLSTFSFLSADTQRRAGLSESGQEHFTELVPYHEVAHQWWGNVVGWNSYRDQWIDEAIANYLALLFADSQKNSDHALHIWLDRYRHRLLEKNPGTDYSAADLGALDLGNRLSSSRTPNGFEEIIYSKGAWVIHMLREMMRQPGAKNPDARFTALLRSLETQYAYRGLSTEDLQHEVEAVMTPSMALEGGHSMDWFFEEWVRGTGIPRYKVEFTVHHDEKGYTVRGKLFQAGVPRSFIANVPLYISTSGSHSMPLGIVTAAGPETSFHFTVATEPHKIIIDPQQTLLCATN